MSTNTDQLQNDLGLPAGGLTACATEEETEFKKQVYNAQIKYVRASGGRYFSGVQKADLNKVDGDYDMAKTAAEAAKKLLTAIRSDFKKAHDDKDEHALRVVGKIEITSAYRSPERDFSVWDGKYEGYYRETAAHRKTLKGGEFGAAAAAYLAAHITHYKSAPGYGNHTRGIAFDIVTDEKAAEEIIFTDLNSKGEEYEHKIKVGEKFHYTTNRRQNKIWEKTWVYQWLDAHAADYGFHRITTEAWHWEYKP